ncbi:DUF1353 domain-containing protein [Duganella sp. FT80W]|uniref:DUF1353 domain-containing protein n=1 Tax=Duganella guangzhouensis TaxID=2666084 RepID=A0A6I2KU49_9BURK|nr:DUF1353 domain-containing protein [Duganella guangzhouensis]
MRLIAAAVVAFISACASIPSPSVSTLPDGKSAILNSPLVWSTGGETIVVPRGFYTDYASVPFPFKMLLPSQGRYSRAAIVHDYLYWTQACTRKQADAILLRGMRESGVDALVADAVYGGVRLGGWWAWKTNRKERASHLPKVVPPDNIRAAAEVNDFNKYRKTFTAFDPADTDAAGSAPGYCSLGSSITLPVVTGEATDPVD